jgi:hypothetical protein
MMGWQEIDGYSKNSESVAIAINHGKYLHEQQ